MYIDFGSDITIKYNFDAKTSRSISKTFNIQMSEFSMDEYQRSDIRSILLWCAI